jgi:hypothetical protein
VLLLAPTWIALNAASGCGSASRCSSSPRPNPDFPDQTLMRGFDANQITVAAIAIAVVFGAGLLYWGNRFKALRRTTIILYGILGGAALGRGRARGQPRGGLPVVMVGAIAIAGAGLFVLAGATPAALGLLADISERFPRIGARSWASTPCSSRSARSPAA